jgi:hypothetical protein
MAKNYLQAKKNLKGCLLWKAMFFITFSLEKHHLDTKQARKPNPNL